MWGHIIYSTIQHTDGVNQPYFKLESKLTYEHRFKHYQTRTNKRLPVSKMPARYWLVMHAFVADRNVRNCLHLSQRPGTTWLKWTSSGSCLARVLCTGYEVKWAQRLKYRSINVQKNAFKHVHSRAPRMCVIVIMNWTVYPKYHFV